MNRHSLLATHFLSSGSLRPRPVGGELQFSRIYSGLGAAKAETREAECGVAVRSQAKPSIRSIRKLLLWATFLFESRDIR